MRLKSLEAIGFKSFANRTYLEFHAGITAIVGPNGCGKSNVLDAIRWVLGEQSPKALRGGNMQDVIFNGTEKQAPFSMAEVSLTFEDCESQLGTDFHEITVTRRVFRDGGSEYEMNKKSCRLRDIHELFMDTGIGQSAYSIMEQGKIDQLLSSRPEDRRLVFEEAAGVTKYKSQRKEALRKLEHTEGNLLRLEDILSEVKRQINSLQRQANKARRYRERTDELQELESQLARHQFDLYSDDIHKLKSQASDSHQTYKQLHLQIETEDQQLTEGRQKLEVIEAELGELRDCHNASQNTIERAGQNQQTNEARVVEFTELRQKCLLEVASAEGKVNAQEEQLASMTQQLEESQKQREETRLVLEQKQEEAQVLNAKMGQLEAERAEQETVLTRLQQQASMSRNKQEALHLQQKNFLFQIETLQQDHTELGSKLEEEKKQLDSEIHELESAQEQLQEHTQTYEIIRLKVRETEEASRALQKKRNEISQQLQKLLARREALTQLEAEHAGSPASSQEVLQAVSREQLSAKLLGTLSDHFQVTPGNEAPLALLLGEAVGALLIEKGEDAEAIARYLEEKKQGTCWLASLELVREIPSTSPLPTSALPLVQPDNVVAPLLTSLLADSHIVDNLAAAYQLKLSHPHAAIATRDGAVLTSSGLIHLAKEAGSSVAILRRQNEIRQLDKEIVPQEAALLALEKEEEQHTEQLHTVQTQLAQTHEQVQESKIHLATLQQSQKNQKRTVQETESRCEAISKELNRLHQQNNLDHEQQIQLQEQLASFEEKIAKASSQKEAFEERLAELAHQETQMHRNLTELQVRLATQEQQCENAQQQRDPIAHRLIELRETIETRQKESFDYEQRIVSAQEVIAQSNDIKVQEDVILSELQSKTQVKQEEKKGLSSFIEERQTLLRKTRHQLQEVQSAHSQQEIALERQKMLLDHLRERMRQAYQLELEALPALPPENLEQPTDWESLEKDVKEKRHKIDAMGPVNLEAISEYEELEQRHRFLEEQQNDMLKAKEQLHQAITQINQTTQKLFAETFEQIRINFQQTFSELFGGGKANLVLTDEQNSLESGIDIIAKPPGKQLQSISLLSGGEKTMTAVALLFAIYMVKPAPFCILDEMDAPLDESNINRFILLVQRFVEQSQFILITHNKRTISIADVLYGVTMEERGISKTVSVQMNKKRETSSPSEVALSSVEIEESETPSIAATFGKRTESVPSA